jgi:hypothetical protein
MLDLDVGNGEKLHLLVDSGADISLLKSRRLLGTAEFEPRVWYGKVRRISWHLL